LGEPTFIRSLRVSICGALEHLRDTTRLQSKLHARGESLIFFELVEDLPGDIWRLLSFAKTPYRLPGVLG
jgi:hypothetical protein